MDSSRAAAIASAVLAHEALTLVSAHHPRGLASFAVDAHVARCELDLALSDSGRGVRFGICLGLPLEGLCPGSSLIV